MVLLFEPDANDADAALAVYHAAKRFFPSSSVATAERFVEALSGSMDSSTTTTQQQVKAVARLKPRGVSARTWKQHVSHALRAAAFVAEVVEEAGGARGAEGGVKRTLFVTEEGERNHRDEMEIIISLRDFQSHLSAKRVDDVLQGREVAEFVRVRDDALRAAAQLKPPAGCGVETRAICLLLEACGVEDAESEAKVLCKANADAETVLHRLHGYRPEHISSISWDGIIASTLQRFLGFVCLLED
mmetsp:Transcript_11432/g.25823  ORF Transcript_11432/g.25823 Transcript_11432/m.25823 type:complete len:245 (+) Transcript_11432:1825-2559(+)